MHLRHDSAYTVLVKTRMEEITWKTCRKQDIRKTGKHSEHIIPTITIRVVTPPRSYTQASTRITCSVLSMRLFYFQHSAALFLHSCKRSLSHTVMTTYLTTNGMYYLVYCINQRRALVNLILNLRIRKWGAFDLTSKRPGGSLGAIYKKGSVAG